MKNPFDTPSTNLPTHQPIRKENIFKVSKMPVTARQFETPSTVFYTNKNISKNNWTPTGYATHLPSGD